MNEQKIEVTVLGVSAYDFVTEEGKQLTGTSVWYQTVTPEKTDTKAGFLPKKVAMNYETFNKMKDWEYPCKANALLASEFTSNGVRTKISEFQKASYVK